MSAIDHVLASLDLDELTAWVTAQRWFSAKSREVTVGVRHADVLDAEAGLGLVIAEARAAAGTHELFQLLVGVDGDGVSYDALADPAGGAALARLLGTAARVGDESSEVSFHWEPDAPALADPPAVRMLGAEQSNTSVVIDDEVVLKVFRHLEPGENPELEMLQFLSGHGFTQIPDLVGWYQLSGDILDATLGVAQGFLHRATNGWDLALDELGSGSADRLTPGLADLGAVIGEMHAVLGSDTTDPDFAPEAPGDEALALFMATVDEEIEHIFSALPDHPVFAPIAGRGEELSLIHI